MKLTLLLLTVAACACVAYAEPQVVTIDVDEFLTELRAKVSDEAFLQKQLGPFNAPNQATPGQEGTVQRGWTSFIPWGQVFDLVVDVVKKVAKS